MKLHGVGFAFLQIILELSELEETLGRYGEAALFVEIKIGQ
jgi:hypothetical protein